MLLKGYLNCEKVTLIPVIQIEPSRSQPRFCFGEEELRGLSDSIKENGLFQPLSVRKIFASKFELIAGERRFRAAIMAGLKRVPCLIFKCEETQAAIFALLDNIQRYNLNMFEKAECLQNLIQVWGVPKELLAKKLGEDQSDLENKLKLLRLTKEEKKLILTERLNDKYVLLLLKLNDEDQRKKVLNKIIADKLSIFDAEILIKSILNNGFYKRDDAKKRPLLHDFIEAINTMASNKNPNESVCFKTETSEYIEYTIKFLKWCVSKESLRF